MSCYHRAYALLSPSGLHGFLFAVSLDVRTSIRNSQSSSPFRLHMVFLVDGLLSWHLPLEVSFHPMWAVDPIHFSRFPHS